MTYFMNGYYISVYEWLSILGIIFLFTVRYNLIIWPANEPNFLQGKEMLTCILTHPNITCGLLIKCQFKMAGNNAKVHPLLTLTELYIWPSNDTIILKQYIH